MQQVKERASEVYDIGGIRMLSLSRQLSQATRPAHARLEALPFAAALADGSLALEGYLGYLRVLTVIHAALEHALSSCDDARVKALWDERRRRLPALQSDLAALAPRAAGEVPAASSVARRASDAVLERSLTEPVSLLGYLYVLEGSRLGATVLGPQAERAFGIEPGSGVAYLSQEPSQTRADWERFCDRLDALELTAEERVALEAAAFEAYAGIEAAMQRLHPLEPSQLAHQQALIDLNPEAGAHTIAQDPAELEAVRAATLRCLEDVPYLTWRFGERGRRFSDSDGAWLVSLLARPSTEMELQLRWLAQVLASRGLPRNILAHYLRLLFEELRLRLHDADGRYEPLKRAAERLTVQRQRLLDDPTLVRLSDDFEAPLGADGSQQPRGSAAIVINALIDERSGFVGARESVLSWYLKPDRFPEPVQRTVRDLVRAAQAQMGR